MAPRGRRAPLARPLAVAPGSPATRVAQGALPEPRVARIVAELALALAHCHARHVIHRDIKPENILLGADGGVRLADFGWCAHAPPPRNRRHTVGGTPAYFAPELVEADERAHGGEGGHTVAVDLWCVGVLCFELLYGHTPFDRDNTEEMYEEIAAVRYAFPDVPHTSADAKDLIRRLLAREPSLRPSAEAILRHRFVREAASAAKAAMREPRK